MKNQEKGVTLIALVITIIVLMIIAGISIGSIANEKRYYKRNRENK